MSAPPWVSQWGRREGGREGGRAGTYLGNGSGGGAGFGVGDKGVSFGLPSLVAIDLNSAEVAVGSEKEVF